MFKELAEAMEGSHRKGAKEVVYLAAGSEPAKCLGKGNIEVNNLPLPGSLHVHELNNTLLSVGTICEQGKIVVFTENEAVIVDKKGFDIDEGNVIAVAPRNKHSGLYEFLHVAPVPNSAKKILRRHGIMAQPSHSCE